MKIYCARTQNLESMTDAEIFDWICGKDLWICVSASMCWGYSCYVRILKVDKTCYDDFGYYAYYNIIRISSLMQSRPHIMDMSKIWDDMDEVHHSYESCLDIDRPIEIITSKELEELLTK